jgi:hypothetical protein
MGNEIKRQILVHNGVLTEEIQKKPSVMFCLRCSLVNSLEGSEGKI